MDLTGLASYLDTQENSFRSILNSTKDIDPLELKRTLTKHHVKMITIAGGKYPIQHMPLSSNSPSKANYANSNKRPFTLTTSGSESDYPPPTKTSAVSYGYTPNNQVGSASSNRSSSALTKRQSRESYGGSVSGKKKTPTTSLFGLGERMQPGGASRLFSRAKENYIKRASGFNTYIIDDSSSLNSENEEVIQIPTVESAGVDIEAILGKGVVSTPKISLTTASERIAALDIKQFLDELRGDSGEETFSNKRRKISGSFEFNGSNNGGNTIYVAFPGRAAASILETRKKICTLEKSVAEVQSQLAQTSDLLARKPLIEKIRTFKALIQSNKKWIEEVQKDGEEGGVDVKKNYMAATVEDHPDEDIVMSVPTEDDS